MRTRVLVQGPATSVILSSVIRHIDIAPLSIERIMAVKSQSVMILGHMPGAVCDRPLRSDTRHSICILFVVQCLATLGAEIVRRSLSQP